MRDRRPSVVLFTIGIGIFGMVRCGWANTARAPQSGRVIVYGCRVAAMEMTERISMDSVRVVDTINGQNPFEF